MKTLSKIVRGLVYSLPAVLFFSYYPVIALGANGTMNFELSLPLVWLVVLDGCFAVAITMQKRWREVGRDILHGCHWLVFPVIASLSILWSLNTVRGILTGGILWLLVVAIYGIVKMRDKFYDDRVFEHVFLKMFLVSALVICGWCVLQCVMDALGVPRECTLMCRGCVSQMFGFPHPNGFAIEPQFMGNLLLAPALVTAWMILTRKQGNKNFERERSRGDNFCNRPVGAHTKLQFRDSLRGCCKSYAGSRSLCSKFLLPCFFVFTATLFLTFSRGAIYALVVGMVFMTGFVMARKQVNLKRVGAMWGMVLVSFVATLNAQGILAEIGPTSDTYGTAVVKVTNHLSLGLIDLGGETVPVEKPVENFEEEEEEAAKEEAVFDGYVEESTNVRMELTRNAILVWKKDWRTALFGIGLGGAGQAMYDAGLTGSPKEIVQNEYASLLVEVGILGVVSFAWLVVLVAKEFLKSEGGGMLLSLLVAYGVSLMFFSGFANALQIYLLPAAIWVVLHREPEV